MPDWLLIVTGLVAGLALIGLIVWVCVRLESRPRKSRLAERSGEWDSGHGLGGGTDP